MMDRSFVRGLMGPIGSGKSSGCAVEAGRIGAEQKPGPDGVRRTRGAVIRNTYRELADTTVKTWLAWWPEEVYGAFNWQDMSHVVRMDGIEIEVLFRALDKPADVKKLLSLELTWIWFNEAREIPKAIIDAGTGRVGRYPAQRDGGPTWFGVIMDTNPPDTDHWWYRIFEEERPEGWALFKQPSGRAPDAENLENLPPGYYRNIMAGKKPEWIKVYVDGEYGFVQDGRPVFPEYIDSLHCQTFDLNPRLPLYIGIDFGLTPAAGIGQRSLMGQWRWRRELVSEHMGAERFGRELQRYLQEHFGGFEFAAITGDPAGTQESQADENTPFKMLAAIGIHAKPAHTNDPTIRREAVAVPMTRIIDGSPGFLIHPDMRVSRKGFAGGYRYKRVQVVGDERFHDKPDKNMFSHVCEAVEYGMLGGGEGKALLRGTGSRRGELRVESEYSALD
jgi:hypothetical protein